MSKSTKNFTSSGTPIRTELFIPNKKQNGAAIIIAHGSDGIVDNENGPWLTMMTGYANDLADKGFVVSMPYYFGGSDTVDFMQIPGYQNILADAVTHAMTLPGIDTARVGLLGFSLGGYLCLRNRSLAKVLVAYFAPLFPEIGGIAVSGNPPLHAQIHHGDKDELLKYELNGEPIQRQLGSEGSKVDVHVYKDAGHGFSGKYSGDAEAQKESKKRTFEFFENYL